MRGRGHPFSIMVCQRIGASDQAEGERGGEGEDGEEEHLKAVKPKPLDLMKLITVGLVTPAFTTNTQRLPIVTDRFRRP